MNDLLDQIETAVNNNLYYLALLSALALPDIFGALDSKDGKATGPRYEQWFDVNLGSKYKNFMNGKDCYKLRCATLHQMRSNQASNSTNRFLFLEPPTNTFMHKNIIQTKSGRAINIDIKTFCLDIVGAARLWIQNNQSNVTYQANYKSCFKRYPNGLSPFISGAPVIS